MAQKKKSMFFSKMVTKHGASWIEYASGSEISNSAVMLFRDIAYGSIDKTTHGHAFFNDQFMATIKQAAIDQAMMNNTIKDALEFYFSNNPTAYQYNQYSIVLMQKYYKLATAYGIILSGLDQLIIMGDNPVKLSILDQMASSLSIYKRVL